MLDDTQNKSNPEGISEPEKRSGQEHITVKKSTYNKLIVGIGSSLIVVAFFTGYTLASQTMEPLVIQQSTQPSNTSLKTSDGFSNIVCSQNYGIVKMSGKFTNGPISYRTIMFTLGVIGSDGSVIATGNGFLFNVGAHDTRIFEAIAAYSGSFKSCQIEVSLRS